MKDYEDLKFDDDFMFCKILIENEDLCKELTELSIGRKIGSIIRSEKQKAIQITADGHGVRFDVYFEDDEKRVYDIEMQRSDTVELPLRSRYYQGMIDLDYLEKGHAYKELPDSYIIFLCTFDLFKRGYHKYSFTPKCREVENLELKDGTDRIFICAGGDRDDVSEDMKSFISYLVSGTANSPLTSRIDTKVREAIEKRLWRNEYMTYKEHLEQEYNLGRANLLIEQICKKLAKGKTYDVIAEELEESPDRMQTICEVAREYAPEYDKEAILKALTEKNVL